MERPEHPTDADTRRSAELLFERELATGLVGAPDLDRAAVRRALRSRPVPPVPVRFGQLLARRQGRLRYDTAVAPRLLAARRDVIGEHAAGSPRFLVRVDEFPHYRAWDDPDRYGTDAFRRFDAIMTEAGVPYLIAVSPRVSRAPLDPRETASRPLLDEEIEQLRELQRNGTAFALHGRDHRTRFANPRRHSELCGLDVPATAARLDDALHDLDAASGVRPRVFVPPFNRFDAAQYAPLAARFPIICGGPETIGTLGFHATPLWRDGAVYLPSYFPLYGRAREVLPAARAMLEGRQALWAPITLHWGWEADEDWQALRELTAAIAGATARWQELLNVIDAQRAAAGDPASPRPSSASI